MDDYNKGSKKVEQLLTPEESKIEIFKSQNLAKNYWIQKLAPKIVIQMLTFLKKE